MRWPGVGHRHRKSFKFGGEGHRRSAGGLSATVKDVLIQIFRNAAVHGLETPDVRRAQSKAEMG